MVGNDLAVSPDFLFDRVIDHNANKSHSYPAEIVPLKIRAPTNALATSGNWVSSSLFFFDEVK
jgi:hypothetical protein